MRNENPLLGNLLRRVILAINTLGQSAGHSPTGHLEAPPQIGSLTVKASGGNVHAVINDPSKITRPIEYWLEHTTDANLVNWHPAHLMGSRESFLSLPGLTDAGGAQPWFFRAYSQYPGGPPSAPVYFGGQSPSAVTVGGTVQLTPLAPTGSGTASTLGGQGGWGRGKVFERPSQGKR